MPEVMLVTKWCVTDLVLLHVLQHMHDTDIDPHLLVYAIAVRGGGHAFGKVFLQGKQSRRSVWQRWQ